MKSTNFYGTFLQPRFFVSKDPPRRGRWIEGIAISDKYEARNFSGLLTNPNVGRGLAPAGIANDNGARYPVSGPDKYDRREASL